MNTYDVLRNLGTPGVMMTAHIDPKIVGKRMLNASNRLVESLIIKGGYRSKSAQLAKVVAHAHKLPTVYSGYSYVGVRTADPLPDDVLRQIDDLIDADYVISCSSATNNFHKSYLPGRRGRAKLALQELSIGSSGMYRTYIQLGSTEMADQIARVLSVYWLSVPSVVERRDAAVRSLLNGERIPFDPYIIYT